LRNQPKYSFLKNSSYALKGLKDMIRTERSFQIEIVLAILLSPILFIFDLSFENKMLMLITLFGVLIAESINSAIERVVDLFTLEHHVLAGAAKDIGSTLVFLNIVLFILVWGISLFRYFYL